MFRSVIISTGPGKSEASYELFPILQQTMLTHLGKLYTAQSQFLSKFDRASSNMFFFISW